MEFDAALLGVLALGLAAGAQHAFEADHVAAVSSVISGETSWRRMIGHGALWGFGHTLTLGTAAAAVIVAGARLDPAFSHWLETAVGVMLMGLGLGVLRRLRKERVHFHAHAHADGSVHFHAHSHKHDARLHDPARHEHNHAHHHAGGPPWRALAVGLIHGMAGSAALIVLAASELADPYRAMLYVVLFGAGSMLGMIALTAVFAVPLRWTAKGLTRANRGLQTMIGVGTAGLGLLVVVRSISAL